jgi:DNA polymerase IV
MTGSPGLCRECGQDGVMASRCPACGSPRLLRHPRRDALSIAHVDCDAFFASVEKRDDPRLRDKPLIIGGGRRGVVATCCYIARRSGVRSAMPMFKALEACPHAVVLPPDIAKYSAVSRQLREMMLALTPVVEPLSIDEAFLDLSGTQAVHKASPAILLSRFQRDVEAKLGITLSVGLSSNKFLAKFASDMNKPRGFTLLAPEDAPALLAPLPVERLWGVGPASAKRLDRLGIRSIGDLQPLDDISALRLLGEDGLRLAHLSRGEDHRHVTPERARKSVSAETTFADDHADRTHLEQRLRDCATRVGETLRAKQLSTRRVVLKLKTARFQTITRSRTLAVATQSTATLIETALALLAPLIDGTGYRLIGVGADIAEDPASPPQLPLDPASQKRLALEQTVDALRGRFGDKLAFGARRPRPRHDYGEDE